VADVPCEIATYPPAVIVSVTSLGIAPPAVLVNRRALEQPTAPLVVE
jgi:hypothetical protein